MRTKPDDHPRSLPPEASEGEPPAPLPGAGDSKPKEIAREIGGPKGPEPTRYGDWEVNGRCTDF